MPLRRPLSTGRNARWSVGIGRNARAPLGLAGAHGRDASALHCGARRAATAGDALSDGLGGGGAGAAAHEALARFVPWLTPWCTRLSNSSATATAWLSRAHAEAAAAASHAAESVSVPQPWPGCCGSRLCAVSLPRNNASNTDAATVARARTPPRRVTQRLYGCIPNTHAFCLTTSLSNASWSIARPAPPARHADESGPFHPVMDAATNLHESQHRAANLRSAGVNVALNEVMALATLCNNQMFCGVHLL